MKNHRSVCRATAAGYTEYKGLPGRVQIGCTNTPAYKSLYCDSHKPTIASSAESDKIVGESPVGLIIAKRETRSSIMYKVCVSSKVQKECDVCYILQVLWLGYSEADCTWEPASSLPVAMVTEYEEGVKRDLITDNYTSGGQTLCTMASVVLNSPVTPVLEAKKLCLECTPVESASMGYVNFNAYNILKQYISRVFVDQESGTSEALKCNTEKDKHHKHHYTAGIVYAYTVMTCVYMVHVHNELCIYSC